MEMSNIDVALTKLLEHAKEVELEGYNTFFCDRAEDALTEDDIIRVKRILSNFIEHVRLDADYKEED